MLEALRVLTLLTALGFLDGQAEQELDVVKRSVARNMDIDISSKRLMEQF